MSILVNLCRPGRNCSKMPFPFPMLFLITCIFFSFAGAEIRLPSVIGSGMVLQQNESVAVWGWAETDQKVAITPSWDKKEYCVISDIDGKWMAKIKTPSAGGPYTITIKGDSEIVLDNILIGEVWLCSGQSNMEMSLGKLNQWQPGVKNYERELAVTNYPQIRLFDVARNPSAEMEQDCQGQWNKCSKETAAAFSAAGFFFGKNLHIKLRVPIGLIK